MVNYEERKNTHRCTYCGAQLPDGYLGRKCQTCQDKVNQRQNARYQERKAAGLCVQCGARPAVIGRVKCEQCLNREIYNRHKILTEFFIRLGVAEGTAREDACLIEHDISEESFHALCRHLKQEMPAE